MATPEAPLLSQALAPIVKKNLMEEAFRTGLSILLVYSTHYGSAKLYNLICVPDGVWGYFFGFISTASPWCKFVLEVMKVTENQYSTIILIVLSRLFMQAVGV